MSRFFQSHRKGLYQLHNFESSSFNLYLSRNTKIADILLVTWRPSPFLVHTWPRWTWSFCVLDCFDLQSYCQEARWSFPASLIDSEGLGMNRSSALKVKVKTKTFLDYVASFVQNRVFTFSLSSLVNKRRIMEFTKCWLDHQVCSYSWSTSSCWSDSYLDQFHPYLIFVIFSR